MLGSGACVALFGAAYFWQIHSMTYFIAVQVVGGERALCAGLQQVGAESAGHSASALHHSLRVGCRGDTPTE